METTIKPASHKDAFEDLLGPTPIGACVLSKQIPTIDLGTALSCSHGHVVDYECFLLWSYFKGNICPKCGESVTGDSPNQEFDTELAMSKAKRNIQLLRLYHTLSGDTLDEDDALALRLASRSQIPPHQNTNSITKKELFGCGMLGGFTAFATVSLIQFLFHSVIEPWVYSLQENRLLPH